MLKSCCTNWGSKGGGSHEQREKCNKRISKVSKGKDYFENVFIHKFDSITTIGLLLTLVMIFSFQGNVGLSQILCKHRNAVQIEQNLFKAEVAQAAAALFSK